MSEREPSAAVVYCDGAFNTPNGKTAHGLIRFTRRYDVVAVVDCTYAGSDAGSVLDGRENGIPVVGSLDEALSAAVRRNVTLTHFVVGLAPDGGRLSTPARADVLSALTRGLHVVAGLHDYLSEDPELSAAAAAHGVTILDIRKPPDRNSLHFFTGRIEEVTAFRIAVLGTDSAVGKRTTAWRVVDGFEKAGYPSELIGTGQTAWLQGVRYGIMMDAIVNDFVSGEIENAVYTAWIERNPAVIVIEGQGSLMNPAYPGGFEILAAGRPDVIVLQHAPGRKDYDGFPGYPIHPLSTQIAALELVSGKQVVAITINHEGFAPEQVETVCDAIEKETGLPAVDVLVQGTARLVDVLTRHLIDTTHKRKSASPS
jgi:uncharacterized NAD-dependent epimerase/dehydratase family protein